VRTVLQDGIRGDDGRRAHDRDRCGNLCGGASAEKIAAVSMWRDSELFDEPEMTLVTPLLLAAWGRRAPS